MAGKKRGPNRRAIARLLGQISHDIDPATKQAALSMADALDADGANAQMWRTYRETIAHIVGADDAHDETESEVEAIRSTAQVGHLQAVR